MHARLLMALLITSTIGACAGRGSHDASDEALSSTELAEGLPDFDGVSLALDAGDDGTGALATDSLAEATIANVRSVNHRLKELFTTIEAAIGQAAPPTIAGSTGTWLHTGPNADWKLEATRTAAGQFKFELSGRPLGSTDEAAWVSIAKGALVRSAVARRGVGFVEFDLTAHHGLKPDTFHALGRVKVRFAHTLVQKRLKVRLDGYQDNEGADPVKAGYVYARLASGRGGVIRLAAKADLHKPQGSTGDTQRENLLLVTRWIRNFKGRLDAIAFGGDIPGGSWARRIECWNDRTGLSYGETFLRAANAPGRVAVPGTKLGEATGCPLVLRGEPAATELPTDDALVASETAAEQLAAADEADTDAIPELSPAESE